MKLELTQEEINGIIMLLAQTQTASGFYPLLMKIDAQLKEQLPKTEDGLPSPV